VELHVINLNFFTRLSYYTGEIFPIFQKIVHRVAYIQNPLYGWFVWWKKDENCVREDKLLNVRYGKQEMDAGEKKDRNTSV